ncbi:hypothetical protein [Phenylobacterium sp.]|uniref:hypothetical protein n=1 Tax=Phenylobacterium sp. TaxID=1871053 RepID=UPI00301D8560
MGVMSNRQRRQMLKAIKARPQHPARDEVLARAARTTPAKTEPEMRDGLQWLIDKGRLTAAQRVVAGRYRDGYRDAGEVSTRSCLDASVGGGGVALSPVEAMSDARRQMFVWRYAVLRGQVDMLTVLDGVCGAGHTVRYLAGGDQGRARELEAVLKVALDMLVAFEAGPPEIAMACGII